MSSSDDEYDEMPELTKERERLMIRKAQKMGRYSSYYIVEINWWNAWTKYATGEGENPGALENNTLFDENGVIKKDLVEDEHYIAVDKESMSCIIQLYGLTKNEHLHKGMLTTSGKLDLYPLKLKLLHRGEIHNFEFPASESPENLKKVLCSSLHQNPNLASLWRIPKEVEITKYTQDDIFPLLDEESLTICGIEEGDVLKLDTESIQNEENINFAAKLKNKLHSSEGGDEDEDEDGPRGGAMGGMGGMGGMRGMGGMGGMGGMNLMMMMMGMGGMGYEDMENDNIKRAIKESLELERKQEEEKKKKEEEELRKKKEQEEIELQRKKIQEFANKESTEEEEDEDYDPIDPNNLDSDDDEDDDDDEDNDDEDNDDDDN